MLGFAPSTHALEASVLLNKLHPLTYFFIIIILDFNTNNINNKGRLFTQSSSPDISLLL